MDLHKDIRLLRFMCYRMNNIFALFSHCLRFVLPFIKPVEGVKEERKIICGMKCSIFTSESTEKGTLLSLHGGAFASPAAPYHKKNASIYATCGYKVIMPDYPLLPFHHHPEALERITALAESTENLSVIEGDSAGGFLALQTVSRLKDKPDLMLIYPVVMTEEETASMREYENTPMWNGRNNRWMVRHYLNGHPVPEHDTEGIRRAFIETAEYDPLHDEGIMIYQELTEKGTETVLSETEGTLHGYDFLWKKPYVRMLREKRLEWLRKRQ